MSDRAYCYPPEYRVLRNRYNIRDQSELDSVERLLVAQRLMEPSPTGNFGLIHLKAIHRYLFQDIYEWAGEIRTVEISKDGSQFQFRRFIETGMADVHRRLVQWNFLKGLKPEAFARQAGQILGDVNYVHPFREGNGRTQLVYLKQLADQAGHVLDLTKISKDSWIAASKEAHVGKYSAMSECIATAIRAGCEE